VKQRLTKLKSFLSKLGVDAVFVSNPVNIRYLIGHQVEDAWFLVTSSRAFYITDFRYIAFATKILKGSDVEIVQFEKSLFETAINCSLDTKVKILGFEENHLTYYQFLRLKSLANSKLRFKGLSGTVEALRVIKEPGEILTIRSAVAVNLKGFQFIKEYIRVGVSEREILYKLQDFIRQEGVLFAFPPIIASGSNASYPHARISDRKLGVNDPLLLDFGVEKDGYKSDLTRMFILGKMPRPFEKNLSMIRRAQEEAFKAIKPGVSAASVDGAARKFLDKHGLSRYFGHSLGHGVGLETHEMPRISTKSTEVLLENMIITVEPGIYFNNRYGVRLEEMVLVTDKGCEVLSGYRDY
jgi:Xaa-Pro aminopeptidase